MIVAAAFCPHPPVLVPDVAQQAAHELADLRSACRVAVTRIAHSGRRLAIVGAGERDAVFDATARGSFAGYGVDLDVALGSHEPGEIGLPLSLTVGAWLVRDALGAGSAAIGVSISAATAADADIAGRLAELDDEADWALVVMGDGSARRSTAAPGYLDARAEVFDASVAVALASGRSTLLSPTQLDPALGAHLLAAGVPAWTAVGTALGDRDFDAEVLFNDAPYGVGYFVAIWT